MIEKNIIYSNQNAHKTVGYAVVTTSLTIAFGQMPGVTLFGVLFFVLLVFAAWTSSISLLEPAVTWLVEQYSLSRNTACLICGFVIWSLGIGTIFSFNIASEYTFFGRTFLKLLTILLQISCCL